MTESSSTRIIKVSPAPDDKPEAMTTTSNGEILFEVTLSDSNEPHISSVTDTALTSVTDEQVLLGKHTVINEQLVLNVLHSRPTIRRGRQARPETAFPTRHNPIYKSYHHRPKTTPSNTRGVRRSSSLPMITNPSQSSLTLEDIEDEEGDDDPFQKGSIRKSTRRIKERIKTYQQTHMIKPVLARRSIISDFRYVKWPKIKSRLQVIRSWELWKGHMKEVEGHFGTAVVSYFIFLRWLFIMNILIFALWFGFVVIPNAVYISFQNPPKIPSMLSCTYDHGLRPYPNYTCDSDFNSSTLLPNPFVELFYQLSGPGYSCSADNNSISFGVQTCGFESRVIEDVEYMVAGRESGTVVTVSNTPPVDCVYTDANGTMFNSSSGRNGSMPAVVTLCSSSIDPYFEWYQYVIDFVLGEGIFNDTVLFYGRYSNEIVVVYNLPLAYLLLIIVVFAVSVILLVYKLGHAYNESYVEFGRKRHINFCNKLFTAWDFNITDPNTARLKKVQICTDLEEELADYEKRHTHRTAEDLAKVIVIRIFTNLFTLIVLLAGGVAIFYAAEFGLTTQSTNSIINLEGLLSPIIITLFNLILPFLFSFLARFERFKTQSGEIKMTLFRAIVVRLSSLIVLIATLYIVIQCTQDTSASMATDACGGILPNISITTNRECPVCWETFIGQEFYKLALTNFVISAVSTIGVETFRNVVSRFRWKGLGEKIGKGNFNIPKSILDLIYTQSLLWLGFIFTPLSPAIILATSFMLFYVKKYSLVWNLAPSKRKVFRAARTNFIFIFLMLLTLFLVISIIAVAIASLRPSESCGPFRGQTYMYSIIPDLINLIEDCSSQRALNYFGSFGFQVPVYTLLLLVLYAQYVTLKARKGRFKLIKKQLILEGANVTHIVGKLDSVLQTIAEQRDLQGSEVNSNDKSDVNNKLARVRESISEVESFTLRGIRGSAEEQNSIKTKLERVKESISEAETSTTTTL